MPLLEFTIFTINEYHRITKFYLFIKLCVCVCVCVRGRGDYEEGLGVESGIKFEIASMTH